MFAYCMNNPIYFADISGTAARISFGDTTDLLSMPWEGAGGGGGINLSASGSLVVASLKFSDAEEIRNMYGAVEQMLLSSEITDLTAAFASMKENRIYQAGKAGAKITKAISLTYTGFMILISPVPTLTEDLYGLKLMRNGLIYGLMGLGEILAEWRNK